MLSPRPIQSRDNAATERRQLVIRDVAVGAKRVQHLADTVFGDSSFVRKRVHVGFPIADLHEQPCREWFE